MRILRIGSTGDDVIQLQSALINLGYTPGTADGIFGAKTASAVIQFQKNNGLVSDGLVGPMTWGKIKSLTTTYEIYIIQPGDTFYKVAIAKNITLSELLAANQGINPNMLIVGQAIQLPPGETHNCGFMAIKGEHIYYFQSTGTDVKTGAIYKVKKDGTERVKLVDTGVSITSVPNINVVGDWVYFRYSTPVNYTYRDNLNNLITTIAYVGSINKIRTNGTENTRLSDDNALDITVLGGWIYYTISKIMYHDDTTKPGLYKIKTDGTGKVKLEEFRDMGYIVNINDGFIYYYNNDGARTNRMALDGTVKTQIIDGSFMAYGTKDWIYYIVGDFATSAQIYKMKLDGSQKTWLYDGPPIGNRLYVYGSYVYFGLMPGKGTYKVKTDGSGLTKISDDSARYLCITDDYIYYYYYNDSGFSEGPIRIKHDGTDRINLAHA